MRFWFFRVFCFLGRILLSLRYKIEIKGKEKLTKEMLHKKGGVLFLPNHPAHIDPLFVVAYFWPKFFMRPLVIDYMYRLPGIHFLMKQIRALPIPNFESSINEFKLKQAEESLKEIEEGLKRGDSFLLYPSGRIKETSKEVVGGASATHSLLQKIPETNVVLVRTTGLWGSIFSRALTHKSPPVYKNILHSLWILAKNIFLFTPRRKVILELEVNPVDFPWDGSRIELNRFLEGWYNRYPVEEEGMRLSEEKLTLISHSIWRKELPKVLPPPSKKRKNTEVSIPVEVKKSIYQELAVLSHKKAKEIEEEDSLALDLGLDSLNIAHLIAFLSDHFSVKGVFPENLSTVRDVLEAAVQNKEEQREEEETAFGWPKEKNRPFAEAPVTKTIYESFLRSCDRMKGFSAVSDDLVGVLTYSRLKIAVFALAESLKEMPGEYVAIMLPASVGAYISILATLFAGKVPVMLNWTLGAKYLNETVRQTHSEIVISSWRFLEKLSYVEFGEITPKIRFLEDIKRKISIKQKLKALFFTKLPTKVFLWWRGFSSVKEDDPCVILFTSGTETIPKGVPLSHKNILSDENGAMQCVRLSQEDILLGILPPFHSFGFSVAGLFPILAGVRVAFSPDPTDSFSLVKAIQKWKATVICSAPSFLKALLHIAKPKELKTLRLFVTGAEKTPEELYKKVYALGEDKVLVEGYGITECSPILTLNRPNLPPKGVGQPIPGVEFCVIHPETKELLDKSQEGELCVKGPNVFGGYLGDVPSPFIQIKGETWYRTGDLGHFDEKGNLILSGRLKRFTKLGGEMISLGGLEATISQAYPAKEEKYNFAVCAYEKEGEAPYLTLFTTENLSEKEINHTLKKKGFSRLVKIQKVVQLAEIPITGTGKIDYRKLQGMLEMGR